MNRARVSYLSSAIIACGCIWACQPKHGSEIEGISVLSFKDWCPTSGSQNCSAKPIAVDQKAWDAGLSVSSQILNSPSSLDLSRQDFDNSSLRSLFAGLGAADLLNVVRTFPWSSLSNDLGGFILKNAKDGVEIPFNGLKLVGGTSISVRLEGKRIRTKGLALVDKKGIWQIQSLDLSRAGLVNLVTDKMTVNDIPLTYFSGQPQPETESGRKGPSFGNVVKSVVNLAMDSNFGWGRKVTVLLKKDQVKTIDAVLSSLGPRDSVTGAIFALASNSGQLLFGGDSAVLASVSRDKGASCVFKIVNAPVVRNVDLKMTFASSFGLQRLKKGTGTTLAEIEVFGIETNFGKVKSVTIEAEQMIVNLGIFKAPIAFNPKDPLPGDMRIDAGKCVDL
jgi:hypothetical protein